MNLTSSIVPLLLLLCALVFAVATAPLLFRAVFGRLNAGDRCYECGFNIRQIPDAHRCPECGSPILPKGARPPTPARTRLMCAALAIALLLPMWLVTDLLRKGHRHLEHFAGNGIAATFQEFADGSASATELRAALRKFTDQLSGPSANQTPRIGVYARSEISSRISSEATKDAARLLADPTIDPARQSAFLAEFMAAYRMAPLTHSTQADDILAEFFAGRRLNSNPSSDEYFTPQTPRTLSAADASLVLETLLAIQGEKSRSWNHRWGEAIEYATARGIATQQQFEQYFRQSIAPAFRFMTDADPRAGDTVRVFFDPGWRAGSGMPIRSKIRILDPEWAARCTGPILAPETWSQANSNERDFLKGLLMMPDRTGKVTIACEIEIEGGAAVALSPDNNHSGDGDSLKLWQKLPDLKITVPFTVEFELKPSAAPPVSFVSDIPAADLALQPRVWMKSPAASEFSIIVSANPLANLAMRATLRQNGRDYDLGWAMKRTFDYGQLRFTAKLDGIDTTAPFDLILRSDSGPLLRPILTPTFWKGEVVLKDQTFPKWSGP